jgi:ubiquinone biosynthesis protein COQ4
MTSTATASLLPPVAPAPPRNRVQWGRARTALRSLVADPERTEQVFELIDALAGESGERHFQRFLRHPNAPRLLAEKPDLLAALSARHLLRALPEGSLGRVYAAFMSDQDLSADGLVEASEDVERQREAAIDPDRDWFYTRLRDMHDLWHVLTDYGRDLAGEAANLAFTYAQTRNRGIGAIVGAAALLGPKSIDCHWQRYLLRAWRRGRRAQLLAAAPYEELLPLPLHEARERLGIDAPELAHPGGIIVANDPAEVATAA